jgi:hypothetical protein
MYQRGDTWYEFLLKQFNPSNFDYGTWMEERRQVLLLLLVVCAKQWIDHRRAIWITVEMMTDLYVHHLFHRAKASPCKDTH